MPEPSLTDAQLIARTRAGDMASYDELYRRHVADARKVARIVTDNQDEAEEVVAEAFTRVLTRLRAGGGPETALPPYLRTVVRRIAVDRHRFGLREGVAEPAVLEVLPGTDDEIARATDRQMVRQAFETLPPRWQRVLWHTEIEGRSPASLAPELGSSPNAVAALAYRAREGLRQAYLSVHVSSSVPPECRSYVPKLAAYVREALPAAEDQAVAAHLESCAHCRDRRDEMLLLVSDLRSVLAPALLGPVVLAGGGTAAAGAAVAGVGATASAAGDTAGNFSSGGLAGKVSKLRPRGVVQVAATSIASAAAATAVAVAAVSAMSSSPAGDDNRAAPPPPAVEQDEHRRVTTPAANAGMRSASRPPSPSTSQPTTGPGSPARTVPPVVATRAPDTGDHSFAPRPRSSGQTSPAQPLALSQEPTTPSSRPESEQDQPEPAQADPGQAEQEPSQPPAEPPSEPSDESSPTPPADDGNDSTTPPPGDEDPGTPPDDDVPEEESCRGLTSWVCKVLPILRCCTG